LPPDTLTDGAAVPFGAKANGEPDIGAGDVGWSVSSPTGLNDSRAGDTVMVGRMVADEIGASVAPSAISLGDLVGTPRIGVEDGGVVGPPTILLLGPCGDRLPVVVLTPGEPVGDVVTG
jgi:hypothetical protein